MCDELEILEFIENDAAQHYAANKAKIRRLRSAFDIDEEEFIKYYRLSKDLVHKLCEELRPHMPTPSKSFDLPLETKVLLALNFYATGSYQSCPLSRLMSRPAVSSVIRQITRLLNLPQVQANYIKFPRTPQERRANVVKFFKKFGMPGVLGCINCTHIAIVRPSQNEERYFCRKLYHSLHVQLICNADMEIISVDASYGGTTHEAFIWNNHPLKKHMEETSNKESLWLLADAGYPLRRYLMTPITNTSPGTREDNFTDVHKRTHNIVQRTIGLLKSRFRCLSANRMLHYTPEVAASVVNACVLLHNMCIQLSGTLPDEDVREDARIQADSDGSSHIQSKVVELNEGLTVRQALVARLWESRA